MGECDKICDALHIPENQCDKLCLPVYKRFLLAAVTMSKQQMKKVFENQPKATFSAANRYFHPAPSALKTSDVKVDCLEGEKNEDQLCVPCTTGTYYDKKTNTCQKCRKGYYQSEYRALTCERCPDGTISFKEGSEKCETVRCYDIATWRKIGCFYAAPQQVSHHNGRLSRLPVMRLADDGGSRLVACAGSYLRFHQADTADVSSAPINLSAASPAPLTNLVIRNQRIYLTDFFDRIVVHPLSAVEGGTDLDKPLFKRNIRGIVDFRVDEWRLYLLVDDNAEPGIHFYS